MIETMNIQISIGQGKNGSGEKQNEENLIYDKQV